MALIMDLCLVRHGPPARKDVCYGWHDIPLAEPAQTTAESVAVQLPDWALQPDTPIFSSPSTRCSEIASALSRGRSVKLDERLREVHFGAWEGQRWDDIPRPALDSWAKDPYGFAFPDGESVPAFIARCQSMLADLPPQALVVTHAGVIRAFMHLHCELPLAEAFGSPVPFASVHTIRN
ncbi:MAG: histidine phosphatase family protein [Natronospirillum sp.]|uniref:histidine phosphatase family protein n=1 Tax=Natronospirillum sp. TaxID=2812955 RepID=UPI0025CF1897|nr:histidine phosphatase family protein [Natronospirillum sp.]MCH8553192.1 histidine phosphatase family protein [Natronospirillum sp.]